MDEKIEPKYRRMNFDNRIQLHKLLSSNATLSRCAADLGYSPSTIAREIKRNRIDKSVKRNFNKRHTHLCIHRYGCTVRGLCMGCRNKKCWKCQDRYCHTICTLYG